MIRYIPSTILSTSINRVLVSLYEAPKKNEDKFEIISYLRKKPSWTGVRVEPDLSPIGSIPSHHLHKEMGDYV